MKKFLLFIILSFAFANAQLFYDKYGESRGAYKDSMEYAKLVELAQRFRGPILVKMPVEGVKPRKNLEKIPQDKIQRTFEVRRDSLRDELWLEVEKNEIVKICVDGPVVAWETSMNSNIFNDSCLVFTVPTLIGVESIKVYLPESDSSHKINLAVGMKYLDFKNEEVLVGFNELTRRKFVELGAIEYDPEKHISVTGTYLVDKYPVTNCEFTQIMWDSIPAKASHIYKPDENIQQKWVYRKKLSIHNKNCDVHDSAANIVYLQQALKYANARSIREGLKPYYIFSETNLIKEDALEPGKYIISNLNFSYNEGDNRCVLVSIDSTSDGYRLPFYDEWMMFARGGDKEKDAPWDGDSTNFETTKKYAKFATAIKKFDSDSVGQLQPNGYGLYDIFGLVWEHVLFKTINPNPYYDGHPACLKGGDNRVVQTHEDQKGEFEFEPHWKLINYGFFMPNWGLAKGGFRLIRNIGNNAMWEKVEAKTK